MLLFSFLPDEELLELELEEDDNELLLLLLMILLEVRIEAVSSVVKAAVLARREIYRCRIVHNLGCISAAPMQILLLLNLLLPNRISNIVWVKKDQFLVIVGDG